MSGPDSTSEQASRPSGKPSPTNGHFTDIPAGTSGGSALHDPPAAETRQDPEDGNKSSMTKHKRRKNRHRKRRNRRPSFLGEDPQPDYPSIVPETENMDRMAGDQTKARGGAPFYKLGGDMSSTSLESDALLDHRNQLTMRPRRESRLAQSFRPGSISNTFRPADSSSRNAQPRGKSAYVEDDDQEGVDDRTPLIRPSSSHTANTQRYGIDSKSSPFTFRQRHRSMQSDSSPCSPHAVSSHDINNPPSMPSSPMLGPDTGYDDAVVTGAEFDFGLAAQPLDHRAETWPSDMLIDVDGDHRAKSSPGSAASSMHTPPQEGLRRRHTIAAEEDVCFPIEDVSEVAEEGAPRTSREEERRKRRTKEWPDLSVLEDWSREEKEGRTGVFRTKKINEPVMVAGRLRPQFRVWRHEEEEAPYRFTYFNEEFQSTIHAQTISELVQPGSSFRELFIPEPPELDDSSDEDEMDSEHHFSDDPSLHHGNGNRGPDAASRVATPSNSQELHPSSDQRSHRRTSIISEVVSEGRAAGEAPEEQKHCCSKPKRYGPRPAFWLDVLSPTDAEMRVMAKAFGIHALTAEDIMMQEAREKVELFRNYYFLNYRTFEQDPNSEDYLQPVNMYVIVFRDGVLSFHFSQTPHPANVRRRIRQLMDYLILSSDWISYALIDDITDVFGPLIQSIEDEVDEIDEMIMQMHTPESGVSSSPKDEKENWVPGPGEMLRRVGVCRKKVMGIYRLLSNKADVVKGFAKRCNEHWEVAPKSEIGLYLGDIQDHIMTMTSSLTYYETLLSRAHTNYLAQINIHMNERQEQTADVLGKLTVLGTIVLPLNIICGMWGMNVKVPGQDVDSLWWFYSITAGLALFAFASFIIAKRVYNIV